MSRHLTDRRHYLAYANLAQVYQRQGKPDEAVAVIRLVDRRSLGRGRALYVGRADVEPNSRVARLPSNVPGDCATDQRSARTVSPFAGSRPASQRCCSSATAATRRRLRPATPPWPSSPTTSIAQLLRVRGASEAEAATLTRCDPATPCCPRETVGRGLRIPATRTEGLDDFAGAIEDITQTLSLQPGQPALLTRRGELYLIGRTRRCWPSETSAWRSNSTCRSPTPRWPRHRRVWASTEAAADAEAAARLSPAEHRVLVYSVARLRLAAVAAKSGCPTRGWYTVAVVSRYQDRAVEPVLDARGSKPCSRATTSERVLRPTPRSAHPTEAAPRALQVPACRLRVNSIRESTTSPRRYFGETRCSPPDPSDSQPPRSDGD